MAAPAYSGPVVAERGTEVTVAAADGRLRYCVGAVELAVAIASRRAGKTGRSGGQVGRVNVFHCGTGLGVGASEVCSSQ